ncbi:hypothetical protein B296_00045870, partial [Ensete ventricosum]
MRFAEGIGKLAVSMLGDHQKKTERLTTRMPEAAGLAGMLGQSQVRASGRGSDDAKSSPKVSEACWEFVENLSNVFESLLGRCVIARRRPRDLPEDSWMLPKSLLG